MSSKLAHHQRILAIMGSFLKLGFTAFGGPAAAVAMMRQEFVLKHQWLNEDEFLDLLGITNLVPGPNATELAIHIGYKYAGWLGLVAAGVCYILPAMFIVLGFAWAYVRFGALPTLEGVLYGIKPIVAAILLAALVGMLKPRLWQRFGLAVTLIVFIVYLAGLGPLVLLIFGGVMMRAFQMFRSKEKKPPALNVFFPLSVYLLREMIRQSSFNLLRLFWVFLKAGALMYGSGYVLLAFIQEDLVAQLGWLTRAQLADAIAVGQVTPGPLSTTATFVGYLTGGLPGALLATLAMFLPGFIFVALTHPLLGKLRESENGGSFLDGVNFAALGLMAGITWQIGRAAIVDPLTGIVASLSLVLLLWQNISAPWLIIAGALVGGLRVLLGG